MKIFEKIKNLLIKLFTVKKKVSEYDKYFESCPEIIINNLFNKINGKYGTNRVSQSGIEWSARDEYAKKMIEKQQTI